MADEIFDLLEDTAREITAKRLGVKFTKAGFRRYCDALSEQDRQKVIEHAIYLLESSGYTVTKDG